MNRVGVLLVTGLLLLSGAANAAEIANGSFEDATTSAWVTQISDWDLDPTVPTTSVLRAGVFTSFDGFTATHGSYFAILTNRLSADQAAISSTVTLNNPIQDAISFDYVYATSWSSDVGQIDPFTVTVTDLTNNTSQTYTIADTASEDLSAGSLSTIPFEGYSPYYDTGWQTYTIDIADLLGSTIQIEFQIEDALGGMSAIFLDEVQLVPEPATLFLFGAGFLGIGLYGRRKLRARKAR
jgi:hypothetical protein